MSQLSDALTGAGLVGIGAGQAAQEHDAFGGSTLVVAGLLAVLGAQEADKAAAWRVADIAAMRALLNDGGVAVPATGDGMTLTELDAAWAILSDALIAYHAAVETTGDTAADAAICAFYRDSTARRELVWPI
jgi:hypothetical protein